MPPALSAVYILLVLSKEDLHGYAIMKHIELLSNGQIIIGPATLYTTIKRLLQSGYIMEVGEKLEAVAETQRRRYYHLTEDGSEILQAEMDRMESLLTVFKTRLI